MGIRGLVDQSFGTHSVPAAGTITLSSGQIRPPYFGTYGTLVGASINAMLVDEPIIAFRANASSHANLLNFQAQVKIQSWPMNSGGAELDAAYPEYTEDVTAVFLAQGGNYSVTPWRQGVVRVELVLTNNNVAALSLFTLMTVTGLFREGTNFTHLGLS